VVEFLDGQTVSRLAATKKMRGNWQKQIASLQIPGENAPTYLLVPSLAQLAL
jgi:hypothetical protein